MELVMIVCSATLQEDMENLFKKLETTGYTHIPTVHGSGKGGGTRLDTEVWPGMNLMYFVALEQSKYQVLKNWVSDYRKTRPREGLKIFNLAMKEML
ncbi:MAG: PG0541 family transporter-associated protein [Candidatus Riflebacteria bacterium]